MHETDATWHTKHPGSGLHGSSCRPLPHFRRLQYFYGQMLGAHDFQTEQAFFREKMKLHNRCLHGYGVVCGLLVQPGPADIPCGQGGRSERARLGALIAELEAKQRWAEDRGNDELAAEHREEIAQVTQCLNSVSEAPEGETEVSAVIDCGTALDCEGNEIVLREPLKVDLWRSLSCEERKKACGEPVTLYVSLCYCEQPVDPVRPVLPDACGATSGCLYGKLQDSLRVKVSTVRPCRDHRCEPCCEPCADPCLLLARIRCFRPGRPLEQWQIHNEVRRRVGLYQPTTITGISWTHGAKYSVDEANEIIGTENEQGIRVEFSAPVLKSTLKRGVVDLWVLEGGKGLSGEISHKNGTFSFEEEGDVTTWFSYRQASEERVNGGDRVLIIIRTAFILDRCCRPVDGAHVGGNVPIIPDYERFDRSKASACPTPPWGYGPWTSGNGTPGSTFESWFFVHKTEKPHPHSEK